jgi:hypothetical protein
VTRAKTESAQPDEWGYSEGSTPHYQGQVYDSEGKTVAITYSDEGGINAAAIVREHNAGPEMLAALEQIASFGAANTGKHTHDIAEAAIKKARGA